MPTGNTSLLGLALPVQGELSGTWGDVVNQSITELVDTAVAGTTTLSTNVDVELTTTALATNQARQAVLLWTASNGATTRNITAPARSKPYIVINAGTGSIVLRGAGSPPTTGVTIIAGERCLAAWNGSDFVKIATTAAAAGSNTQVQFNSSGNLAGSANLTFDGTNLTLGGGTANGVAYLNGSKVLTTGSALTYNGTNFRVAGTDAAFIAGFGGSTKGVRVESDSTTSRLSGVDSGFVNSFEPLDVNGSYLTFSTSNTERMRLTSTGLGIGTSSPAEKLSMYDASALGLRMDSPDSIIRFMQGATTKGYVRMIGGTTNRLQLVNNSNELTLDSSGNLGLGVTPSAWGSAYRAIEVGGSGTSLFSGTGAVPQTYLTANAFFNGTNWIYKGTYPAIQYEQSGGQHKWNIAASGTAGNAISFTQSMTLDSSGNLFVGATALGANANYFAFSPGNTFGDFGHGTGVASTTPYTRFLLSGSAVGSIDQSGTSGIALTSAAQLVFNAGGTERARISSAGFFGLGTNNPQAMFDLAGDYKEGVVTANTGTAYTINTATGTVQILTLTGNCTFTFPTAIAGESFTLFLRQDGTGGRTVTWPANVRWPGGTAPTITSTASRQDKYIFTADGTNFYGSNAGQNYTV